MNIKQTYGTIMMMASYTALILLMDWPKSISSFWIFLNVAVFTAGYVFTWIKEYPK